MKQSLAGVKVLLLDIVLEEKWTTAEFQPYKEAFPTDAQQSPELMLAHVRDLTVRDVKIAYLKNLQGYLWESGYKTGAYATPLFSDITSIFSRPDDAIPPRQKATGYAHDTQRPPSSAEATHSVVRDMPKVIYSSGSIFAQKLLFAHSYWPSHNHNDNNNNNTESGHEEVETRKEEREVVVDLTPQITAYYDTTTAGLKTSTSSYEKIFKDLATLSLAFSPSETLFLSDNVSEIQAALEAGMKAVVIDRPGNAPLSADDRERYDVVTSFEQLSFPSGS